MSAELIMDGYTRTGYIAAVAGLYDALRFTYRPATWRERRDFSTGGTTPEAEEKRAKTLLKTKLLTWDATTKGQAVPVSADAALNLPPLLLERLLLIILGQDTSDPDPNAEEKEKDAEASDKF